MGRSYNLGEGRLNMEANKEPPEREAAADKEFHYHYDSIKRNPLRTAGKAALAGHIAFSL